MITRTLVKKIVLGDRDLKGGKAKTIPEVDIVLLGIQPVDLETEKRELLAVIGRLTLDARAVARHPVFGKMTYAEWCRLVYRHADYHLKQFGV